MPLLWSTILIINNYLVKHLGSTTSKTEAGLLMPHGWLLVFATLGLWCHVSSLLRSNVWKMETAEGGLVNPHGWRFHTVLPSNPTSAHNPYNPAPDSITEFKIKNEKIYLSDSWIGKLFVLIFELAPESFFAQIKPISYLNLPSSAYMQVTNGKFTDTHQQVLCLRSSSRIQICIAPQLESHFHICGWWNLARSRI